MQSSSFIRSALLFQVMFIGSKGKTVNVNFGRSNYHGVQPKGLSLNLFNALLFVIFVIFVLIVAKSVFNGVAIFPTPTPRMTVFACFCFSLSSPWGRGVCKSLTLPPPKKKTRIHQCIVPRPPKKTVIRLWPVFVIFVLDVHQDLCAIMWTGRLFKSLPQGFLQNPA